MEKSQEDKIIEYLKTGKSITPLDALKLFGCMRLGARIFDLKRKGYRIEEMDVVDGRKRYARYFLEEQNEEAVANNNLAQEEVINRKAIERPAFMDRSGQFAFCK